MKRRNPKTNTVHTHECLVFNKNGKRYRKYLPVNWWDTKEGMLLSLALDKRRQPLKDKRCLHRLGQRGRPRILPEELKATLSVAGYKLKGTKMQLDTKRYFSEACTCARFAMLSDECRTLLASPDKLLHLERTAWSKLKSASRKGQRGLTFEGLVEKGILDYAAERARA